MIIVIVVVAVMIRLIALNQSLWWDEAINVVAAKQMDFGSFVSRYPIGDFHPPLYFGLLWLWGHLFGFSEVAVRWPSVILGTLTVLVVYLLGKSLLNRRVGLIAALLVALSPLLVYYSQEARMYALSTFSVVLTMYCLDCFTKGRRWARLGLIISLVLVFYSDYVAYLIVPVQLIYVGLFERKVGKSYLACLVVAALSLVPWWPVFLEQLRTGIGASQASVGWRAVVGSASLKELGLVVTKSLIGRISFDNKIVYGMVVTVVGLLNVGLMAVGWRKLTKGHWLLLAWLVLPVLMAFGVSLRLPVLAYFRVTYIIPALAMLVAVGLVALSRNIRLISLCLLIGANLIFLAIFDTSPQWQREDWRGVVSWLDQRLGSGSVAILEDNNLSAPIVYYSQHLNLYQPGLTTAPAITADQVIRADQFDRWQQVYLVDYLVEINDPNRWLAVALRERGYQEVKVTNFNGVGFIRQYSQAIIKR